MTATARKSEHRLFSVDRSATGRFWTLTPADEALVRRLSPAVGGSDLMARLLAGRGVDAGSAATYLTPTLRDTFPGPSSFADMDKAAGIVLDAILDKKKITVFADYDVDGGTSSAILTRYFRAWGEELGLYVPDRLEEGYGPSPEAFRHLKDKGNDLVITVDCGAVERVDAAGLQCLGALNASLAEAGRLLTLASPTAELRRAIEVLGFEALLGLGPAAGSAAPG